MKIKTKSFLTMLEVTFTIVGVVFAASAFIPGLIMLRVFEWEVSMGIMVLLGLLCVYVAQLIRRYAWNLKKDPTISEMNVF